MRLEVTRRAELAVLAVGALAEHGEQDVPRRLKAVELAEMLGTTTGFVAQVVTPLVKAGWVRSVPGPTGGYALADGLEDLSVLRIIEAVDGPTATGDCVVEDRPCHPDDSCPLHEAWTAAREVLLETLDATSALAWREGAVRTPVPHA